jgi:Domain of unknown function (DUF4350)
LKAGTNTSAPVPARVRPVWWWALGLTALFAALAYVALNWYVIVDDDEWVGMQGEARTNPYLAMQRTLEEMGASIEVVKGGRGWDAALAGEKKDNAKNATLIVGDRRLVRMTPERIAQIRAWVRAGGNLIIEAEQVKFDDPLLASYGMGHVGLRWTVKGGYVEKREKDVPADGDEPEEDFFGFDANDVRDESGKIPEKSQNVFKLNRKTDPSIITFADNATFEVNFRPYQNLRVKKVPEDAEIFDDKIGTRVVQFRDGLGRVTAISNFDFMTWRALGKHDHAEFLWHVVATQNASSGESKSPKPIVMLALKDRTAGLWSWLGEHAWMVLLTFAVLLLAWIARIIRRFGPLNIASERTRVSLGEHLRALGRYAARQQAWPNLAHAARERFLKRLYRERPGLSRADKTMLFVTLEKLTGMGAARIDQAMLGAVNDKTTFVTTIRSLKAMEAALDHHRQNGVKSVRNK